ncbi:MAG: hypothetical protein KAV87_05875 [Desulfobacteraceae bacterium]|nr:hypothetical protein [Desulfobacteraceae bacterium]
MSNKIIGNNLIAAITGGVFVLVPVAETATLPGEVKTHDEILVENAPLLLNVFGVAGVYRPGVLDREIQVIIKYVTDDGSVEPIVRHRGPVVNVKIANNSVTGVSAEEFEQGHIIKIPPRKGADPRDFQMARIVRQDAGFVVYEVH